MNAIFLGKILRASGVDTSSWGTGETKTIKDLHKEIVNQECYLRIDSFGITRILRVAKMKIMHPELGTLYEESQVLPDGRFRKCGQIPAGKIGANEDPTEAMLRELQEEIQFPPEAFARTKWNVVTEETASKSYPNLRTIYELHTFILTPNDIALAVIRLGLNTVEADGTKHKFVWKRD